jgi:hypothetical protein
MDIEHQHHQQQQQVVQQSIRADVQQLQQLSQLCQPALLMLLEAVYNLLLSDARLALLATNAADLCERLSAVVQVVDGIVGIDRSSEDTAAAGGAAAAAAAAAEDTSAGSQPTPGCLEAVVSMGSGGAVRPMQQLQQQQQQQQQQQDRGNQILFVARRLRQVSCI